MKRIPVIAGNWKMHKTKDDAIAFIYAVNQELPEKDKVETVICAPAIFLNQYKHLFLNNAYFVRQLLNFRLHVLLSLSRKLLVHIEEAIKDVSSILG